MVFWVLKSPQRFFNIAMRYQSIGAWPQDVRA